MKTDLNFVLPFDNTSSTSSSSGVQFITSLSYAPDRRVLAAGTNSGNVAMWAHVGGEGNEGSGEEDERSWRRLPDASVGTAVRSLK